MVGSGPFRGWPAGWWLEDGHCAGRVYRRRLELGMATVKEDMIRLIQDQPDDSSFDENWHSRGWSIVGWPTRRLAV